MTSAQPGLRALRAVEPASPARSDAVGETLHGTPPAISSARALDAAFTGQRCELVRSDGTSKPVRVHRWSGAASPTDLDLFVDPCRGRTLDVGCGPGRLTAALMRRGVPVLGIDTSAEAVRLTRACGAAAAHLDVFDDAGPLLLLGDWQHVLLADGNVGLGGDPVRLLRRVASLLAPSGSVIVELSVRADGSAVHRRVRLRVGEQVTQEFDWATVGSDHIHGVAAASGLRVVEIRYRRGRVVATLRHAPPSIAGARVAIARDADPVGAA